VVSDAGIDVNLPDVKADAPVDVKVDVPFDVKPG
jgi:hypothetical protein